MKVSARPSKAEKIARLEALAALEAQKEHARQTRLPSFKEYGNFRSPEPPSWEDAEIIDIPSKSSSGTKVPCKDELHTSSQDPHVELANTKMSEYSCYLSACEFRVAVPTSAVLMEPSAIGRVCGAYEKGDIVQAVEETFEGWVRLMEKGWVYRGFVPGQGGRALVPVSTLLLLPAPEPTWKPGAQAFDVVAHEGVNVHLEPFEGSASVSWKARGDRVWAEAQTYSGWIRLADSAGWMPARTKRHGQLLRCVSPHGAADVDRQHCAHDDATTMKKSTKAPFQCLAESDVGSTRITAEKSKTLKPTAFSKDFGPINEIQQYERCFGIQNWNFWDLPVLEFEPVCHEAVIRMGPAEGAVLGGLASHMIVRGVLETFDGWVKLADAPGWVCRSSNGADMIRPLSSPESMAVPEVCANGPRRRMFEVLAPSLPILEEPRSHAAIIDCRWCGQFVLAETQTYHGWICLAEGAGWMQSFSHGEGQLLRSVSALEHTEPLLALPAFENEMESAQRCLKEEEEKAILKKLDEEERKEAHEALVFAAESRDHQAFTAALKIARQRGVAKKEIARLHAMFTMDL